MAVRLSPFKVGSFVLGALFLALAMLLFFGSTSLFTKTQTYILYFEDSVKGLSSGAAVRFKGVPVGEVRKILISYNQEPGSSRVPVLISVDAEQIKQLSELRGVPFAQVMEHEINNGLRGQLQMESFITGLLSIELNYFPQTGAPKYFQRTPNYEEIPTVKSPFTDLGNGANELLTKLAAIDYVSLTKALARLSNASSDALENIDFDSLSKSLTLFLNASGNFLDQGNQNDLGKGVAGLSNNLARMTEPNGELTQTVVSLRKSSEQFRSLAIELNSVARGDNLLGEKIHTLVGNLSDASGAVARLADYLERNPSALLTGKGDE